MIDYSSSLPSRGIQLDAKPLNKFGAAADGSSPQLGNMIPGGLTGARPTQSAGGENGASDSVKIMDMSRFAAQFTSNEIGSMINAPKMKFLFKVSFAFNPAITEYATGLGIDVDTLTRQLDFAVKQVDLPKADFEYEEVNMYNFKTRVLKSIKHREINLTFLDDNANNALNMVNAYKMLLQPITRVAQDPTAPLHDFGMSFDDEVGAQNTAGRGTLPSDIQNIISKITIHQFYNSGTASGPMIMVNEYIFVNPRLTMTDINDVDHEGTSFNTISIIFDFDAVHIAAGKDATTSTNKPTAPLKYDMSYDGGGNTNSSANSGSTGGGDSGIQPAGGGQAGSASNQFADARAQIQPRFDGVDSPGGNMGHQGIKGPLGEAMKRSQQQNKLGTPSTFSTPANPPLKDNSASQNKVLDMTRRYIA